MYYYRLIYLIPSVTKRYIISVQAFSLTLLTMSHSAIFRLTMYHILIKQSLKAKHETMLISVRIIYLACR